MSGYTVAIVGGTGTLGNPVTTEFLTTFRSSFPTVRVLVRNPASEKAKDLAVKGAELHKLDEANLSESFDKAFAGVDAIVNTLPHTVSDAEKHALIDAVARSSAKVYFLSEFGVDHRRSDFPGYEVDDWVIKKKIAADTREKVKGKKVVAVYTGIFLQLALAGVIGIDIEKNTFTSYGSPSQKVTLSSLSDIGKALARLSILAIDPATSAKVPDELRIASDTLSFEEVRDVVARVKGVEKGKIVSEDLVAKKEGLKGTQSAPGAILSYIRVLIGEGKLDFSDNSNELINPGESLWKWRTVEDQLRGL
ncbi:NAD-P-binding protein [Lentinus tigrinus ALCF2SS1-7]|uniref:NAD-P-binding protein n=1 Tax=Lentinus tigrinus ALCF2SS1-6 TaxID=1328759 RepID=A0A5C2RX97_9APHY|nr:NAD-P-binding protein [Lentinus tigrinus ALCF2SS1-6]RPD69076.1 NAD-P-binding protein [Lentinus tigrinus ALCF2SS1-7]